MEKNHPLKKNTEVLAVEMAQWLQVLFSSPMTPHQGRKGSRLYGVVPCHMFMHRHKYNKEKIIIYNL